MFSIRLSTTKTSSKLFLLLLLLLQIIYRALHDANAGAAITASRACVTNMGGYDLYWWFTDLIDGKESNHSPTYPIDQIRCMTITDSIVGLVNGDFVTVNVHAVAGVTKAADTAIIF